MDAIKDCDKGKIATGDIVWFQSKIDGMVKKGKIRHMTGGSFGIEDSRHIALYQYKEVDKYQIRKAKHESK